MAFSVWSGFLEFLLLLEAAKAQTYNSESRIVDGSEAKSGEFPFYVLLHFDYQIVCGGSILTKKFVLTAAHCVYSVPTEYLRVYSGSTDLDDLNSMRTNVTTQVSAKNHIITKVIIHEQYDSKKSWKNDIALIKVSPRFKFNKFVASVILPTKENILKIGQVGSIAGFGKTSVTKPSSRQLMKTTVYLTSIDRCRQVYSAYRETVRSTNICISNPDRETGFCRLDSGGPLLVNETVLVGIMSFSMNKGCAGYTSRPPQVLTRVSSYTDWILTHTIK